MWFSPEYFKGIRFLDTFRTKFQTKKGTIGKYRWFPVDWPTISEPTGDKTSKGGVLDLSFDRSVQCKYYRTFKMSAFARSTFTINRSLVQGDQTYMHKSHVFFQWSFLRHFWVLGRFWYLCGQYFLPVKFRFRRLYVLLAMKSTSEVVKFQNNCKNGSNHKRHIEINNFGFWAKNVIFS